MSDDIETQNDEEEIEVVEQEEEEVCGEEYDCDDGISDTASIADPDDEKTSEEELVVIDCKEFIFEHYRNVCGDGEYATLMAETEFSRFLSAFQTDPMFRMQVMSENGVEFLGSFLSDATAPRDELEPYCLAEYKCKNAGKIPMPILPHMRLIKAIRFSEYLNEPGFREKYLKDKVSTLKEFFKNEYIHPDWKPCIDYERDQKNNITKREPNTDLVCYTCNEKKVFMIEIQLRRPDEPMTRIYTCLSCGKEWRS